MIRVYVCLLVLCATTGLCGAGEVITFNDNGGWCWFQDERAIVHQGKLIIGSVANRAGTDGENRWGNVEVATYDLEKGKHLGVSVLHAHLQDDDHDAPALLVRTDGRILAAFSTHGSDPLMRLRVSEHPNDPTTWQPEEQVKRGTGVTYSNLFRPDAENSGKGRTYDFYRGEDWNPNLITSDNDGETWQYAGRLVAFKGRPYVKYASNNRDRIDFVTTEGHPLEYTKTSIYHGFIRGGAVHRSDGSLVRRLSDGPVSPEELTRVYAGDPNHVAWTIEMHLDEGGRPFVVYSVQMNQDPNDNRYRYACWDGKAWHDHGLAFAGTYLCPGEIHYTGLASLDSQDPNVLYISTNADPVTGKPLLSSADGKRHYEVFRGRTRDRGEHWTWKPITQDSSRDNLRPIVPISNGRWRILLWLRGTYKMYTDYDLDVIGLINPDVSEPVTPR